MHRGHVVQIAIGGSLLAVAFASATGHGQAVATPDARLDQLVADVRAIRLELGRALDDSARAHLLVGRLQIQEQRVAGLQQISRDIARQLGDTREARARAELDVKAQASLSGAILFEKRDQFQKMVDTLMQNLERQRRREGELQREQGELENALATETTTWRFYSDSLSTLEGELRTRAGGHR